MSEQQPLPRPSSEREIKVLVTGFGLWGTHQTNPSFEILRLLPSSLTSPASQPKITLLNYPTAIPVAHHPSLALVPSLLSTLQPDLVLHLGLAGGRTWYSLERTAPRPQQTGKDVDGRNFPVEDSDRLWPNAVFPETLETGLSYTKLAEGWKIRCREAGVGDGVARESDNVGRFLCGFTYWISLAWFRTQRRKVPPQARGSAADEEKKGGPVLFLHVPDCHTAEDLDQGRLVTEELIKAMVDVYLEDQP